MTGNYTTVRTVYKFAQFYSLVYVMKTYFMDITQCIGPSMLPTMNISGDIVLVDRMRKPFKSKYKKGMIILAKSPSDPQKTVCKRIVAVADETVSIRWTPYFQRFRLLLENQEKEYDDIMRAQERNVDSTNDSIYVDDIINDIPLDPREISHSFKIPKGYIWIEGDNSSNSTDSRHFGPIPLNLVTGVVICKLWPLNDFGRLPKKPNSS